MTLIGKILSSAGASYTRTAFPYTPGVERLAKRLKEDRYLAGLNYLKLAEHMTGLISYQAVLPPETLATAAAALSQALLHNGFIALRTINYFGSPDPYQALNMIFACRQEQVTYYELIFNTPASQALNRSQSWDLTWFRQEAEEPIYQPGELPELRAKWAGLVQPQFHPQFAEAPVGTGPGYYTYTLPALADDPYYQKPLVLLRLNGRGRVEKLCQRRLWKRIYLKGRVWQDLIGVGAGWPYFSAVSEARARALIAGDAIPRLEDYRPRDWPVYPQGKELA